MMKYDGFILDQRSKKEKSKDYKDIEFASSLFVDWKEKEDWKGYTERNQLSTNSCVAQSAAKILEVLNVLEENKTVVFSASPIYAKRTNKPHPGMAMWDVFDILKKFGTTTEKRIVSQYLKSDAEMEERSKNWNSEDQEIAQTYGIEAYAYIQDTQDIDIIAGHVEAGRPVMLFLYAEIDEYGKYPKIKYPNLDINKAYIRHAVVVVDYGIIKGKKYLKIEDSAHFNNKSVRYLDEQFLKRIYAAGVVFDRKNDVLPQGIKHNFNRNLKFGMRNDRDVAVLQDILKNEGVFPVATPSTGNYLEVTRKGVEALQHKYKLASWTELFQVKGKNVGPKTRKFLNDKYGEK